MSTKKDKPIYLHLAYSTTSKDRQLTCTGDCNVVLHNDGTMKSIKDYILKTIQKEFPEKEWNEITIINLSQISKELYFRLFPESSPKVEAEPQEPTE